MVPGSPGIAGGGDRELRALALARAVDGADADAVGLARFRRGGDDPGIGRAAGGEAVGQRADQAAAGADELDLDVADGAGCGPVDRAGGAHGEAAAGGLGHGDGAAEGQPGGEQYQDCEQKRFLHVLFLHFVTAD